mgnify:CR=1 FL=1|tara:strand:- start:987 stop:1178 length:192 start_codon:yes stop_codon:yes gene_type:complete
MAGGTNRKPRGFLYLMELPINDKELDTIVRALTLGGDTALFQKLKLVKETREDGGKQLLTEIV